MYSTYYIFTKSFNNILKFISFLSLKKLLKVLHNWDQFPKMPLDAYKQINMRMKQQ